MLGAKPERVSPGARFKSYWSSLIFGWYVVVESNCMCMCVCVERISVVTARKMID